MLVSHFLHIFEDSSEPLQHDISVIPFKLENYLEIFIINMYEFHFVLNRLIKLNWICFLEVSWIVLGCIRHSFTSWAREGIVLFCSGLGQS